MRTRLVLVLFLLALPLLAACSRNPATGRNQLILISSEQATALGNAAVPELIQEYGGEVPSSQLRGYVDGVGRGLAARTGEHYADVEWTFTVLDSDVVNAFALPGGNVFISRGLLARFDNEAQVAGVLGHEIGHVTGKHVDEQISQKLLAQGVIAGVAVGTDSDWAVIGTSLFASGYVLHFGRDHEREADRLGVRYMAAAGYDPHGMVEVLEVLAAAAAGSLRPPEILSTHPHPEKRIALVRRLIDADYAYTKGDPSYDLHRRRFQQQAAPYLTRQARGNGSEGPALFAWCGVCSAHGDSATP